MEWSAPVKVNVLPEHLLAVVKGQNSSSVLAFSTKPEKGLLPVRYFHVEKGFNLTESAADGFHLQNVTGEVVRAFVWDWNQDGNFDIFLFVRVSYPDYSSKTRLHYFQFDENQHSFVETRGLFDALETMELEYSPAVQVTDWFSNGHPDLVVLSQGSMIFFKGETNHTITPLTGAANPVQDISDIRPEAFHIVDWDRDGDLDFIIAEHAVYTDWVLRYFERVADGSLRERTSVSNPFKGLTIATNMQEAGLFSLEDTPDSYPNLMLRERWNGDLFVYRRHISQSLVKFNGDWTPFGNLHAQQLPIPDDWSAVDLDNNGKTDLLLCSKAGLQYVQQDKLNTYTVHEGDALGVNVSNCGSPKAVDWDGDGHLDILLARSADSMGLPSRNGCPGSVIQFFKNINGTFADQGPLCWENSSVVVYEGRPMDECPGLDAVFEVADWDNDGLPELLLGSAFFTPACMGACVPHLHFERLRNSTLMNVVSHEDSMFAALGGSFVSLQATDWNRDGRIDLMAAYNSYHEGVVLEYYPVLEDARLGKEPLFYDYRYSEEESLTQYRVVDWDGDGTPELLAKAGGAYFNPPYFSLRIFGQGTCSDNSGCNSGGYCDSASKHCSCSDAYDGADCSSCRQKFWTSSILILSGGRQCLPCDGYRMKRNDVCTGRGTCFDDASARLLVHNDLVYNRALVRGNGTCSCSDAAFGGKTCNLGVCPAGTYETIFSHHTTSSCKSSPAGSYASSNSTEYVPCKAGHYSEARSAACSKCPTGTTTAGIGAGISQASCSIDAEYWLLLALLLTECTCFCLLLFLVISSTPVADITVESNTIVVNTVRRHFFLKRPLAPLKLRLQFSGHPLLDTSEKSYLAAVMGSTNFELLENDRQKIRADVQSSMGRAYITPLRKLLCTGICGVPMVIWLLFFAAAISVTISLQVLDAHWYLKVIGPLALLLALMLKTVLWSSSTPLAKRLQKFQNILKAENPKPEACPRGPSRAVTCGQLFDLLQYFQGFIMERNMYYLCANLVLPLTKPHQLSYAELAGPKDVVWFVSHFWGSPFRHFVDSIRKHSQTVAGPTDWHVTPYWACTFSNNQWRVDEEMGTDCENSSFHLALRSTTCAGTAMVVDGEALPLTRSWCLYEVLTTLNLTQLRPDFHGLWLCTDTGVLNQGAARADIAMCIAKRLANLRLEDASASKQKDKENIDERVRTMDGGFPAVNGFVRSSIQKAIVATKHVLENDFTEVLARLSSTSLQVSRPLA